MTSYVVLARKWRPAQFSDIVGQAHIVRTLSNALRLERIHHAYLFTGSRGIGKTSIARIFAKVLRCENRKENQSCDQCSSCKEISLGSSVDVIEIDGASNNGVEAVREIRENAVYMPATGSRKIYIIDEVHMLTTAAFNALLKTLEEPPAHVVFIFATTEPHKIPATILSRCQRFDYRRVSVSQIQGRLEQITAAENIQAETGALALIARSAEGSMRDALSLLDQVVAFSGNQISTQSVQDSIGLIGGQVLIGIISGIFKKDPLSALKWVDEAYQQGHDLRVLTRGLTEFLHAVLLIKVDAPHSSADTVSEEEWKELQAIAPLRSLEEIELFFQVIHHGLEWIARSPQPKMVIDVLIVKCATSNALIYASTSQLSQVNQINQTDPANRVDQIIPIEIAASTHVDHQSPPVSALPKPPADQVEVTQSTENKPSGKTGSMTWEGLIEHIRKSRPLLASILEHSTCSRFPIPTGSPQERAFTISFPPQEAYFREQLQSRAYQEQLSHFCKDYFGIAIRPQIELKEAGESLAARKEREQRERLIHIRERAQNHPIILEAKTLFGGELGPIDIQEKSHANHST